MRNVALETNIVVRLLTNDEPEQAQQAVALVRNANIWLPKTVLLETAWVLQHAYDLSREVIVKAFWRLLGLANLETEDGPAMLQAITWYDAGMDSADAVHLASTPANCRLATFDQKLATANPERVVLIGE